MLECQDVIPQFANYGSLLLEQNMPEKALYYFEVSKKLISDYLGIDNSDYGIILRQIGAVYAAMQDFERALDCFSETQGILRKVFSEEHPDIEILRGYISQVFSIRGKQLKAGVNIDKITKK